MLTAFRRFTRRSIPARFYSQDFILEEIEEIDQTTTKTDLVRMISIPKHPIFPKHYVRFKLSQQAFKFLIADNHSNHVGAFVQIPTKGAKELETQLTLNTIFPLKDLDSVYEIGAYCQTSFNKFDRTITLKPLQRTTLQEIVEPYSNQVPFPLVKLQNIEQQHMALSEEDQGIMKILIQELEDLRLLLSSQQLTTLEVFAQRYNMRYDEDLLNYIGVVLSYMCDTAQIQKIFGSANFSERLKNTTELVQEHAQLRNSMRKLQSEAQAKMAKASEEHTYKQIMSLIKSKLGLDKDEKETLKKKYEENLQGKTVPEHITKIINEEMDRLMMTDKNNSEFHVIRTYLDWLTCLPYGISKQETVDLEKAKEILDRDHYGMKDVKDRILEFISVSKLRGSSSGKILCFVGPPGVGKTSIGKSIAETLNRDYHRISLGGLDDVAELKGHRRTYIGAQPGKLINALKNAGSENPVILIDEIDKVGQKNFGGSPENALLEILDPAQNNSFNDHYMDTPIDLSKVLFLCTANFPENISPVLLDRMDIIQVQGYTAEEKLNILDKHLMNKTIEKCALTKVIDKFSISQSVKIQLIKDYCREAGVRSLEKLTTKMLEKVARKIVQNPDSVIDITQENIVEFAGRPQFPTQRLYENLPSGVAMGLAYTSMGGSLLYLETAKANNQVEEKDGKITMTGNLKQVMSESIQIAYNFARKFAHKRNNTFLDQNSVHLHVPEGATPKDGPSAGITITTALLSLAFDTPILENLAMTGQISLNGKVMPIGGLKEKIVAAKREGVKTVCVPKSNQHAWQELSDVLKEGIEVVFVEEYIDVFRVAFPDIQ